MTLLPLPPLPLLPCSCPSCGRHRQHEFGGGTKCEDRWHPDTLESWRRVRAMRRCYGPPMVVVAIPASFRPHVDDERSLAAPAGTLREVLDDVLGRYPRLRDHLLDEDGGLHRFVNLYVEDEDVRYLQGLDTPVGEGSTVTLVPAVAGG